MMARTWKVLRWDDEPPADEQRDIELACPGCEQEALLPIGPHHGGMIIAAFGLGLVLDPPGFVPPANFRPSVIQCRKCRRTWESADVR